MKQTVQWALLTALILGGLGLGAVGFRGLWWPVPCAGLLPNECALALEIARAMGRKQAIFGASLALLGAAWAFLRSRPGS